VHAFQRRIGRQPALYQTADHEERHRKRPVGRRCPGQFAHHTTVHTLAHRFRSGVDLLAQHARPAVITRRLAPFIARWLATIITCWVTTLVARWVTTLVTCWLAPLVTRPLRPTRGKGAPRGHHTVCVITDRALHVRRRDPT
jgi:hypothetical protein